MDRSKRRWGRPRAADIVDAGLRFRTRSKTSSFLMMRGGGATTRPGETGLDTPPKVSNQQSQASIQPPNQSIDRSIYRMMHDDGTTRSIVLPGFGSVLLVLSLAWHPPVISDGARRRSHQRTTRANRSKEARWWFCVLGLAGMGSCLGIDSTLLRHLLIIRSVGRSIDTNTTNSTPQGGVWACGYVHTYAPTHL